MKALAITSKGMEDVCAQEINELISVKTAIKPTVVLFDVKDRPKPLYARKGDVSTTLSTVVFEPLRGKVVVYPARRVGSKVEFRLNK